MWGRLIQNQSALCIHAPHITLFLRVGAGHGWVPRRAPAWIARHCLGLHLQVALFLVLPLLLQWGVPSVLTFKL